MFCMENKLLEIVLSDFFAVEFTVSGEQMGAAGTGVFGVVHVGRLVASAKRAMMMAQGTANCSAPADSELLRLKRSP